MPSDSITYFPASLAGHIEPIIEKGLRPSPPRKDSKNFFNRRFIVAASDRRCRTGDRRGGTSGIGEEMSDKFSVALAEAPRWEPDQHNRSVDLQS